MEKHLAQDEIDSMFAQVREEAAKEQTAQTVQAAQAAVQSPQPAPQRRGEPYNFSRAGQISNEQMQAISTINDLFARNLTHNLGAWLRTRFEVSLASAEQMTYSEFTERIPEPAYVCSARLEPLDVMGVVQMDLTMAPPIVDLLLGGVGRAGTLREPTDIEDSILFSVMEIVLRELNLAWQPVGLKFALGKREMEAQVARLMPGPEKTLCVSFEIRMPEAQGSLNLCLPAVVLNTILRRLIAERDRPRRRSTEARARLSLLLAEAQFGAVLQFPPMRLNAGHLAALAPGKLLRLPLARQAVSELRVGGLPMFQAQPVRSGDHRGAQVKGHTVDAQRPDAR
jgi:flagellar motor switch protein FliM